MKKILLLLALLPFLSFAQNTEIWGTTSAGGANGGGTIYKMDGNADNLTVEHAFELENDGQGQFSLCEATIGKLYGVNKAFGVYGYGAIYSFDPVTNLYNKEYDFDGINGGQPNGALIQATDGKIYGITLDGGVNNAGVLFSFDPISLVFTKLFDFESLTSGTIPQGALLQADDGKLYGTTLKGGVNDMGSMFSFDPVTSTFTKLIDFNGASNGKWPNGGLVQATNGKLYGTTYYGGIYDVGTIFSYDITTTVFTKLINFNCGTSGACAPRGSLLQASNGRLYGMSSRDGTNYNGKLFSYNITTGVFTNHVTFSTTNGSSPYGNLIEDNNGKLYGLAYSGGNGGNNGGVLFSYTLSNSAYVKLYEFPNASEGRGSFGSLVKASNGKIYGCTAFGGIGDKGVLFDFNPATNTYTKQVDFNVSVEGYYPTSNAIEGADGILYGMSIFGGNSNKGLLYSYSPFSNTYTKLYEFDGTINGYQLYGSLVQASNGILLGMARTGGTNNGGTLFSFNPKTLVFTKHYDFISNNGSNPWGNLIEASNGKLYGMTNSGGSFGYGAIFSFDYISNTYTKMFDFNNVTSTGAYPRGSLLEASNGKLYGMTIQGGVNSNGILFSFDYNTTTFTKLFDFNSTVSGANPNGNLVEATNGKLYGLTIYGGLNNRGTLFSFDPATNTHTKIFDFDGTNYGRTPQGSLLVASNGKLYGFTSYGGIYDSGVVFEFDPATNTMIKKQDLNGLSGVRPQYGTLIEVRKPVIWTTANVWSNTTGPTIEDVTIIEGNLAVGVDFGDFSAKSLTIKTGGSLTVTSGHTVTVNTYVTNEATANDFIVQNNAGLVQLKEYQNEGGTIVKRASSPMLRLDYTAWSSPVVGQQLQSFSPNTLANRFYTYDPNGSTTPTAYIPVDAQTNFQPTVGYMIRSANNASSTVTHVHNGEFTGVPNNGEFSLTPEIVYNLIGNPYASPISTSTFFNDNAGVGTLYFWTNTTQAIPDPNPPYNNYYPQNNFASQTRFTSVAAYNGLETPNGYIQTGQGFFAAVGFPSQIKFKNSQRVDAVNSSQFFRTAQSTATTVSNEVDAVWLNLNDSSNAYNQMVVGYSVNATNNEDYGYDAKFFGDLPTALYTTINNDAFVIQAKAMPFVDTDVIPLGFKAENQGMFTISLEKVEGLFVNQNVYLKDNLLNIIHDIKVNSYQFTSISGTFNNRFELLFTNSALSQEEFISNSTLVYYNGNNEIVVKSTESAIAEIQLYDVTGRLLYFKNAIGANEFIISKDLDKQLIIVKTKLENSKMNTTKLLR